MLAYGAYTVAFDDPLGRVYSWGSYDFPNVA